MFFYKITRMKKLLIILFFTAFVLFSNAQTVIEMSHPGDANLVLLEVDKPEDADIVVYKTDDKELYEQWDCAWKFKTWGFCNFSVYITKDKNDPKMFDEETGVQLVFNGKIYFTDNPEERGYKTEGFMLEGVFRKYASNEDKKKSKGK
ncbi:MAG: hypothetical protein Kow0068_19460 [Marinilabiliales bacterium]